GGRLDIRNRRIEPRIGVEFAPGSTQPVALRAGTGLIWSLNSFDLEVEAAYVGGNATTTGFVGDEKAVTGGPAVVFRSYAGPWTLSAAVGLELRYPWQHLSRLSRSRAEQAGFSVFENRSFGSLGPKAGIRASLPLGNHFSATAGTSI